MPRTSRWHEDSKPRSSPLTSRWQGREDRIPFSFPGTSRQKNAEAAARSVLTRRLLGRWSMKVGELVRELRVDRAYDPREIISTWTEKDLLDGKVVDAWVIIFRTRGCYWAHASGCSMCGYVNDTAVDVSDADLAHQLGSVLARHGDQPMVKVYTSGNFFDDHEVSPDSRRTILEALGDRCGKGLVETLSLTIRVRQRDT